jgi:uncharacterized protein YjbI with pentapeptide repeats
MPEYCLSAAETLVVRAWRDGESCDLGAESENVLRGEALVRILLGRRVRLTGEDEPTAAPIHPAGAKLRGASVVGALNLDDAAASDGDPLPPIDFQDCEFRDIVTLRRAKLRGLCLANSRLSQLSGVGAIVSGSVDLSGLSTSENEDAKTGADDRGLCWIELREARIEGGLTAAEARLVAPPRRSEALLAGRRTEYALDLRAATIGTELVLSPGFEAYGGVNIRSVRVDCDVSMHGASLSQVEGFALTAAGAKIGGSLLLNVQTTETPVRTVITGGVSFLGLVVEGSLDLRGATIHSLDATGASVGAAALLGAWQRGGVSFPFECRDDVCFYSARIAGALNMTGAFAGRVIATNAYIGAAALVRAYDCEDKTIPCMISGELLMAGTRVVGDLDANGAQIGGLNAQNAQVEGSLYLSTWFGAKESLQFSAIGSVYVAGAKIAGNLNANGASMARFSADNAQIGGAAFLGAWLNSRPVVEASNESADLPRHDYPFSATENVSLMGCSITGNLEMSGATVRRLIASNAKVGGTVTLSALEQAGSTLRFKASEVVSFAGTQVGGNLEMIGADVGALDAQNADIGGSAFLRASTSAAFAADVEVFLLGAKIRSDLDLSGSTLRGKLFANNTDIGGSVWLKPWQGHPIAIYKEIDLSGAKIHNKLVVQSIEVRSARPVKIDLSHSSIEVLDDKNGAAWGDGVILEMEGLHYARVVMDGSGEAGPRSEASGLSPNGGDPRKTPRAQRLEWLALQYPSPERRPNIEDFSPDVYDRLARAFRGAGYYGDARAITRERLHVERRISGISFARPFLFLYAFFFDSGMSPARAVATFLCCIAIGAAAVYVADRGLSHPRIDPVLVRETTTVNSLVVPSQESAHAFVPGLLIGATTTAAVDELSCGHAIEPALYALEAFVPALEIGQERRCAITADPKGMPWRIGLALYAVLGWIVTALTILTVSGVARRHLEA